VKFGFDFLMLIIGFNNEYLLNKKTVCLKFEQCQFKNGLDTGGWQIRK
jgi:hypothetical protein